MGDNSYIKYRNSLIVCHNLAPFSGELYGALVVQRVQVEYVHARCAHLRKPQFVPFGQHQTFGKAFFARIIGGRPYTPDRSALRINYISTVCFQQGNGGLRIVYKTHAFRLGARLKNRHNIIIRIFLRQKCKAPFSAQVENDKKSGI